MQIKSKYTIYLLLLYYFNTIYLQSSVDFILGSNEKRRVNIFSQVLLKINLLKTEKEKLELFIKEKNRYD